MNEEKIKLFDKFFNQTKYTKPDRNEIVVCLDISDSADHDNDFFYGVPTTLAYWDEEKEQWFDKEYLSDNHAPLDFRDMNHNTCGKNKVTHWIDKSSLSLVFKELYDFRRKDME